MDHSVKRVPLLQLAAVFLRIGFSSFGGGVGAWIHRETVVLRNWLTHEEFMAGLALGQVLPGANVSNIAVYVGERLAGGPGAAVALTSLLFGPFVMILLMAWLSSLLQGYPLFHIALTGVASAAVGLVVNIAVIGARRFVTRVVPCAIALATFVMIGFLHWSLFLTVAVVAPVSVVSEYVRQNASKN